MVPNNALPSTFPAFPKDAERRVRVEKEANLAQFYDKIEEASAILKASSIALDVRKVVPTERSLYVICPAPLLPYMYNHFHTTHTFNRFCCSLLTEGTQKKTKESVRSSQMLLRAFLTDPIDVEEVVGEVEEEMRGVEHDDNDDEDNIQVEEVLDTAEVSMNTS